MSVANWSGGRLESSSLSLSLVGAIFNDLDVLSLGRDTAINLGVSYDKVVKTMLSVICGI